jgi:hypothetical protein
MVFSHIDFAYPLIVVSWQLSLEVLDLHNRFECGGDWGLERTFNAWVEKQTWRQLMPVQYFQLHVSKKCLQCALQLYVHTCAIMLSI